MSHGIPDKDCLGREIKEPVRKHKTMRDQMKEKLAELSKVSEGFGVAHSMTIGYIIDDIERILDIVDDSWMGVPWTEFLTCEQEAEVMAGRKAIEELKQIRGDLDKLEKFTTLCIHLFAPDCLGSENGWKECDGCSMVEYPTREEIAAKITELLTAKGCE